MRIRKNSNLSSLLSATAGYGGEIPEAYVCILNQSPWDVIPLTSSGDDIDSAAELTNSSWFRPSSSSSSPHLIHQFNREDSFNGDSSLGDSNGAAQRLNSSMENYRSSLNLITTANDYERSPDVEESKDQSDNSDKKSEPVEPDWPVKTSGEDNQVDVAIPPPPLPPKRGRPRGTSKKASASAPASADPNEFYYYSGFGPRWGRKRGDEVIGMSDNNNKNPTSRKTSSGDDEEDKTAAFEDGSSSFDGFDYMEEEEGDNGVVNQENGNGIKKTKKRGRKPVKERSLKSLM